MSNNLDLRGGGGEGGDFLVHTIRRTGEHGGTASLEQLSYLSGYPLIKYAYHDKVAVELLLVVGVALHDRVGDCGMGASAFRAQEEWLEESFRSTESLAADCHHLTIGKLVRFLQVGALGRGLNFPLKAQSDVPEFLSIS